jgi:hypothetical protein
MLRLWGSLLLETGGYELRTNCTIASWFGWMCVCVGVYVTMA